MSRITFLYEDEESEITLSFKPPADLDHVVERFQDFLLAMGYNNLVIDEYFDGE